MRMPLIYVSLLSKTAVSEETIQDVEKQLGLIQRYLDELPDRLLSLGIRVVLALVIFAIGSRVISLIRRFVRRGMAKSTASEEAEGFLDSALKVLLYVILVFMILGLFGVDAASVATVIGSVGVTVGLAIQGSLSNCIGGIMILILKPFRVGDYIIEDTGKNEGIVQQISVFYTKLATYDNQVILIPNGTLANATLTNVTDEPVRRVDLKVGISYNADIRTARAVIQKIGMSNPLLLAEKGVLVNVDSLADSRVLLAVHFWVKKEDYWQARYEMLEAIKYGFDENGIEIPFNQLDVHIKSNS